MSIFPPQVGYMKSGKVQAVDVTFYSNAGNSMDLSLSVRTVSSFGNPLSPSSEGSHRFRVSVFLYIICAVSLQCPLPTLPLLSQLMQNDRVCHQSKRPKMCVGRGSLLGIWMYPYPSLCVFSVCCCCCCYCLDYGTGPIPYGELLQYPTHVWHRLPV